MDLAIAALTSFAQRLVRCKSVTGHEQEVVALLAAEMQTLGFDRVEVDRFGSLIGWVEGAQPGPTLLLDGHCDTVDADPANWEYDPWGGEIANERLIGRGVADMKASLAAMVYAAGTIERSVLRGRVAVRATVSTDIISEPYPGHSVIPYRCHATYDRRLLPGERRTEVLAALKSLPGLDGID